MKRTTVARLMTVSAVAALSASGLAGAVPASSAKTAARVVPAIPDDFNGDGRADIALGSPFGTVSGHTSAGFVSIIYGADSGLNVAKKQVISQNTAGIPGTAENGNHFGNSLASLDYNTDGFADLLVGSPD